MSPAINELLSEDSLRTRQRKRTVNLKLTIIAWALEFTAGGILMINHIFSDRMQLQNIEKIDEWKRIIYTLDMIFCSVVVPSAYMLKSEEIKKIVISGGWCKPLRLLAPTCIERVLPDEEYDMAAIPNAQLLNNVLHVKQQPNIKREDEDAWLRRIDFDVFD